MPEETDISDLVGGYPTCGKCDGRNIVRGALTEWSVTCAEWVLKTVFDTFACDKCGVAGKPVWKVDIGFRAEQMRQLNDAMRRGEACHGTIVLTVGLKAMGDKFLNEAHLAVVRYQDFTSDNDPQNEHDFGSFEHCGEKLFWKIDYYDLDLDMLSPDPANSAVTHRVLTIMLASEY